MNLVYVCEEAKPAKQSAAVEVCTGCLYRTCPLDSPNPKNSKTMVLGRPKTYAKNVVKKGSPPKGSGPKKKPKTIQSTFPRKYFILLSLGFFLGRLPFGGDHSWTTFLACRGTAQNHYFTIFGICAV